MISTATALTRPCASSAAGPQTPQATNVRTRDRQHGRHEVAGHLVDQPLDRGAAALGLADHADDLGQQRVGADLLGADQQAAGAVDRAADDLRARLLLHRDRLAGDHRLVHRAAALDDDAVHRHLLAGPDAQHDRRAGPASSGTSSSRPSGRTTRAVFGARPSSLRMAPLVWPRARSSSTWPEQHQDRDHGGRVEVRSPRRRPCGSPRGRRPGPTVAARL